MRFLTRYLVFFATAVAVAVPLEWVSVFYFHHVDPKFQNALDYAFKLDLIAIPIACGVESILLMAVFALPRTRLFHSPSNGPFFYAILGLIFTVSMQAIIYFRIGGFQFPFMVLYPFAVRVGLTLSSTRTPPALPPVLLLVLAISAPLIASAQAGPVSFIRQAHFMNSIPGEGNAALVGSFIFMLVASIPILGRKKGWARGKFNSDATAVYSFFVLLGALIFTISLILKFQ